jgi:hypothetical protein
MIPRHDNIFLTELRLRLRIDGHRQAVVIRVSPIEMMSGHTTADFLMN